MYHIRIPSGRSLVPFWKTKYENLSNCGLFSHTPTYLVNTQFSPGFSLILEGEISSLFLWICHRAPLRGNNLPKFQECRIFYTFLSSAYDRFTQKGKRRYTIYRQWNPHFLSRSKNERKKSLHSNLERDNVLNFKSSIIVTLATEINFLRIPPSFI